MKRAGKAKTDDVFLKALGARLRARIEERGYVSPYDFWIRKAGDEISRSSLNEILNGTADAKISTLRMLATLLKIELKDLLDFRD